VRLASADRAWFDEVARGGGPSVFERPRTQVEERRFVSIDLKGRLGDLSTLVVPSTLTALEHLRLRDNHLRALDLSRPPPRLSTVDARRNQLREVRLDGAFGLEVLDLRDNGLCTLDVSPLLVVEELRLSGNPLSRLIATDLLVRRHPGLARAAGVVTRPATAHELHFASDRHNWDDGHRLLRWVTKQPQCDPATALMIYFRAQPAWFYGLRKPDPDEAKTVRWLRSIEQRMTSARFGPATIPYDPAKDVGREAVTDRRVPSFMNLRARPAKGTPPYPFPRVAG